ncbi:MAG: hypothetical protein EZS28_042663, partial [Streblomastix strix]
MPSIYKVKMNCDFQSSNIETEDSPNLQQDFTSSLPYHIILQRGQPPIDRSCPLVRLMKQDDTQQSLEQEQFCWIRNIRIVKEIGRRPWSVQQNGQSDQSGQMIRIFHRFDLYEAETCSELALESALELTQYEDHGQKIDQIYRWEKKFYVYHVWKGEMSKNYTKLPQNVINGLFNQTKLMKENVQRRINNIYIGENKQQEEEIIENDPDDYCSMRLIGFHTLIEAQQHFRSEFLVSTGFIFPVLSGAASEQEITEANNRRQQRLVAQNEGVFIGQDVNGLDPKDLFDDSEGEEQKQKEKLKQKLKL